MATGDVAPVYERWLTKEEAAEALQEMGITISSKTLYARASMGKIPSGKVNNRRRFRLSQLLKFFEDQSQG